MANGQSPVPKMPTAVMHCLHNWTYSDGGYQDTAPPQDVFYLHAISDGDGKVKWELVESVPSWSERCGVSSADNTTIQDCTLSQDGFTLTDSNEVEYQIHYNPGTNEAYLATV